MDIIRCETEEIVEAPMLDCDNDCSNSSSGLRYFTYLNAEDGGRGKLKTAQEVDGGRRYCQYMHA